MRFGSTGFFVDRFAATHTEGMVWLHGYGNVFEKILAPGEQIDVEPSGWIYRANGSQVCGPRTGMFGGTGSLIFNRFTGPGRVGIQSMYLHMPTTDQDQLFRNVRACWVTRPSPPACWSAAWVSTTRISRSPTTR